MQVKLLQWSHDYSISATGKDKFSQLSRVAINPLVTLMRSLGRISCASEACGVLEEIEES
jgi:hypothetical protein